MENSASPRPCTVFVNAAPLGGTPYPSLSVDAFWTGCHRSRIWTCSGANGSSTGNDSCTPRSPSIPKANIVTMGFRPTEMNICVKSPPITVIEFLRFPWQGHMCERDARRHSIINLLYGILTPGNSYPLRNVFKEEFYGFWSNLFIGYHDHWQCALMIAFCRSHSAEVEVKFSRRCIDVFCESPDGESSSRIMPSSCLCISLCPLIVCVKRLSESASASVAREAQSRLHSRAASCDIQRLLRQITHRKYVCSKDLINVDNLVNCYPALCVMLLSMCVQVR